MELIEAELFTDPGNDVVVRLPPRRFPGVLIQGDSLSIIRGDVAEIVEACARGDVDDAHEAATILLAVVRTAATVHGGFTAGTDGGWLIALSAVERCSSDYG
ncbi:DUF6959 family protein [Streptomyces sp. NBC_01750]|uniref:DUF6959 family protein n=1 Tax=Streptomyces sp. NBC_01750 TaxID=2975928 RepID=UPI002DD803B1|nr:hypothetical protein [Streptomyces sp. NBC_01750]WSD37406.1 hypothetical protein OG966_39210 [Streptomyces sp. NBC_01750]